MIADSNKDWAKADSFYEIAVGMTTTPANVLNNWGFSKLSRGANAEAERLFTDAIRHDRSLFTAKNNLVLARGATGQLRAAADADVAAGTGGASAHDRARGGQAAATSTSASGLLRDAMQTHPQHFEAAARSLDALGQAR